MPEANRMAESGEWVMNAAGRMVPTVIDGKRYRPFGGAFTSKPDGRKHAPRLRTHTREESKLCASLEDAIRKSGLSDGMTISFHHHFRNGDKVLNMVLDACEGLGLKDLRIFPSAMFPVHEPVVEHIKKGTVNRIEGSMNGPIGAYVSTGEKLAEPAVLRSHGGRARAIEDGDVKIDLAFIGAPCCDDYGNANGLYGPSACGPLGFSVHDSRFADCVVMITDNLVSYPCTPMTIEQGNVDYIVKVDSIGDPEGIVSGTMKITKSPARLLIANHIVEFIRQSGRFENGFSFQAGAGGISLAVTKFLGDLMRKTGVKASWAMGGVTKFLVDLLEEGLVGKLLDGQAFDLEAIRSLRENVNDVEISPGHYANIHSKGCAVNKLDFAFLGATEIDLDFNVNVNTHSDGILLHGIGGHQDVAAGSGITFIAAPLMRGRLPIIVDRVTTVSAPGETVDVIVTERGIAINPRRKDLIERFKDSALPIMAIEELYEEAIRLAGAVPKKPKLGDDVVALIEFRDGSLLDVVRKVLPTG